MAAAAQSSLERRLRSAAYLKEVFTGSRLWVSVASLGKDAESCIDETQTLRWLYIGVSLAPLLQRPAGVPFLRALLQLQEECQYHFREPSENQKAFRARSASGQQRVMMGDVTQHGDHSDMLKPMLLRVEGKVVYEYLFTPHLAHAISGIQVLHSLCELMSKVYRKLVECTAVPGATQDVLEAVSKADAYFEEHFLAPAAKHADAHAKTAMRGSLGRVDPLFGRLWGQSVIDDD